MAQLSLYQPAMRLLGVSADVQPTAGRFQVELPAACSAAVKANPNLWIEVLVDGASLGRTKIGAVPYALEAGSASNAVGNLEKRLQALETNKSGRLAGMWSVTPSDCASTNSATWADVAGKSVKFTSTGSMRAFATYSINVQATANPGTAWVGTRLVVDNEPLASSGSHYQPYNADDSNVNLNGQHVTKPLAADEHTIKLQWRSSSTSELTWNNCPTAAWGDGFIGGRSLVVQAFYE